MPDCHNRTLEAERLRERIAALEEDRAGLMASVRHMRRGRLDGRYLTDSLRAELARAASPGVLLETIEVEIRCLRRSLTELGSGEPAIPALGQWQEIDRRLNAGKCSAEEAIDAAFEFGLVRRTLGLNLPRVVSEAYVFEPSRDEALVPGPLLLIAFEDGAYGGPHIYRPVSDELRGDTGYFS